jgi:hypothetical protein
MSYSPLVTDFLNALLSLGLGRDDLAPTNISSSGGGSVPKMRKGLESETDGMALQPISDHPVE